MNDMTAGNATETTEAMEQAAATGTGAEESHVEAHTPSTGNETAEGKGEDRADAQNSAGAATDSEARQVMYIGPNRLREGLQKYQIFKGLPKDRVEPMKEKFPHIGRLFVDVKKLAEAMEAVKRKGTPLFLAYQEVMGVDE